MAQEPQTSAFLVRQEDSCRAAARPSGIHRTGPLVDIRRSLVRPPKSRLNKIDELADETEGKVKL